MGFCSEYYGGIVLQLVLVLNVHLMEWSHLENYEQVHVVFEGGMYDLKMFAIFSVEYEGEVYEEWCLW
jgi:hypothetical protein